MIKTTKPSLPRVESSTGKRKVVNSESEDVGITQPFDPTQINISAKQMSLDTLIKRIEHEEIVLSPEFQRNEVWNRQTKSRLIESLLIRIPLPAFYMDATVEDKWLVVDGLQRLATLRDYVLNKNLQLRGLEFLHDFNNYGYDQLPRNYQRRIDETQVTVYLIEKGTPANVKFNVFKRINTGGMPLSSQEIRHALNQGDATQMLKDLAESDEFLTATARGTKRGIGSERMADREAVLRCLAFMVIPLKSYTRDNFAEFDEFLTEAMRQLNESSNMERTSLNQRFRQAMRVAHELFGENAFRKQQPNNGRSFPINKALLDTWTFHLAALSENELALLRDQKHKLNQGFTKILEKDARFDSAISQGTGKPEKVRHRFDAIEKLIRRILK